MTGARVVMVEADDTGEDGVTVTSVSVNGVDVGRMAAAPKVKVGIRGAVTTVTLTLVPSRLEIRGEHADGERPKTSRAGFTADIA